MNDLAVTVEELGKRFRIGGSTPSDRLAEKLSSVANRFSGNHSQTDAASTDDPTAKSSELANEFWALQDVSFEIKRGRVLGIVGRNGAGKSTLLKILSRITEPTTGRFGIRGRVGSLLEVGTGFHPELTGRENIFLSGTLLGMSRQDVRKNFDEIVEFAETQAFLDTPVKRYSSGMRVRLGFAVAAHMNPEVLIVDEVLAVGDHAFQSKCMGKMDTIASEGRTILFVSHNMAAIQNLCDDGILIDDGRVRQRGKIADCVSEYLQTQRNRSEIDLSQRNDRSGDGRLRVVEIDVGGSETTAEVLAGGSLQIRAKLLGDQHRSVDAVEVAFVICDMNGQPCLTLHSRFSGDTLLLESDAAWVRCQVPELCLAPGTYFLHSHVRSGGQLRDHVDHAAMLEVAESDFYSSGQLPSPAKHGRMLAKHHFQVEN